MNERRISIFLHTRVFTLLIIALAIVAAVVAYNDNSILFFAGNRGFLLPSANEWISRHDISFCVNLLLIFTMASLCQSILKTFNPMRSISSLWASFFIILQCALPSVLGQFYGGTLLAFVLILSTFLLFSVYGCAEPRRIFLAFTLVGTGSMFQYAFLLYLPVLWLGLIQMKVVNAKTFLASLLGIALPYWVVLGCGIARYEDFSIPHFVSILSSQDIMETIRIFAAVAVTLILGIGFLIANLLKMLSYNSQVRAYNGYMALMLIATVLFVVADYTNLTVYLPLLNLLSAYQLCFFFAARRYKRSYIPILLIITIFGALYVWSIIV